MTKPLFNDSRLKIERAYRHLDEVKREIATYLDTDFCRVEAKKDGEGHSLEAISIHSLPPAVSLAIGDTLHALHSALDYVTSRIARDAGLESGRVHFPADEKRDTLIASFLPPRPDGAKCATCGKGGGKGGGSNHRIKEAFPAIEHLIIDEIRPYATGDGAHDFGRAIHALKKLDAVDKHRLITPTVRVNAVLGFEAEDERQNRICGNVSFAEGGKSKIWFTASKTVKITNQGKAAALILFAEPDFFYNKPVVPTLNQVAEVVSETVNIFEQRYKPPA